MSKSKTITTRRETYSVRITPAAREQITALTERIGCNQSELIELALRNLDADLSAIRCEVIENARARLAETDEALQMLKGGTV